MFAKLFRRKRGKDEARRITEAVEHEKNAVQQHILRRRSATVLEQLEARKRLTTK